MDLKVKAIYSEKESNETLSFLLSSCQNLEHWLTLADTVWFQWILSLPFCVCEIVLG